MADFQLRFSTNVMGVTGDIRRFDITDIGDARKLADAMAYKTKVPLKSGEVAD
ncbi:15998_t:CDS:2 [Acaulospora morrowiae]|uniref:15998_t:CDS:1 n=1 Tax=Acaulospora morrowiae TaxID=94023 RepID=A0A9N8WM53_9GLOM|nr:15998_t:CDS:2 [Acaulospora morrowiae]